MRKLREQIRYFRRNFTKILWNSTSFIMVPRVRNPGHFENKLRPWHGLLARKMYSVFRKVVWGLRDFRFPPRRLCISYRRFRVTYRSKKNYSWTVWPVNMGLKVYQEMSMTTKLCYVLSEKREDLLCFVTGRETYITYLFCKMTKNAQLSHKISHSYMFRHYRVILREHIINALPS